MRAAQRLLGWWLAVSLVPATAAAQQGKLPWRAGDAPPVVAGLHLGAPLAVIDSVLGKPEVAESVGPGSQMLGYRSRGIALVYTRAESLSVVYLVSPAAGEIGGLRVGDPGDRVRAQWGPPTATESGVALYQVGLWGLAVRLDSTQRRIALLILLRVEAPAAAEGPYDSTADARASIAAALRASQGDHRLVLVDFGANWCLDCLVLDSLFRDSTVAPYLRDHFRVVHVDVGEFNRNLDLSKSYGSPIDSGVPAVVVLAPSGHVIASTADGSLQNARAETPQQILRVLHAWVEAGRR